MDPHPPAQLLELLWHALGSVIDIHDPGVQGILTALLDPNASVSTRLAALIGLLGHRKHTVPVGKLITSGAC